MTLGAFPDDGHFACIVWCYPGWFRAGLRLQELLHKAHSESTVWSKACWERLCFLDEAYRHARNTRHSKATAVKKARMPIKAGGSMGRWIRGLSAGIWLVRLSM